MPYRNRSDRIAHSRAHHAANRPSPEPIAQRDPALPPFGEMRFSEDGMRVQCHVCGRWLGSLNTHVRVHDMTMDAYKEIYELPRTLSTWPPLGIKTKQRDAAIDRDQASLGRPDALPRGRKKGLTPRLGSRINGSRARKGKYRGQPQEEIP
jgi:hypothetical protein